MASKVVSSSLRINQPSYRLPALPTIGDLLRLYKLRAVKQLSQNFLLDPRICTKLVKSAGKLKDAHVIEVGPGPGSLTRPILEQGASSVVVIEKDRRFLPCLQLLAEASQDRLKVIHGDILEHTLENLIPPEKAKTWEDYPPDIHLIGNLPFAISTVLVVKWMKLLSERKGPFKFGRVRMTLTFQQEVATRITAPGLHPERCRLSALVQGYCEVKQNFQIVGGSFVPPPDVDVGVVKLVPKVTSVWNQPFDVVERVLRSLFNTKRRTIENTLTNIVPPEHEADVIPEILKKCDIDPELPTLMLRNEQFSQIIDEYVYFCGEIPSIESYNFRMKKQLRKELKQKLAKLPIEETKVEDRV